MVSLTNKEINYMQSKVRINSNIQLVTTKT